MTVSVAADPIVERERLRADVVGPERHRSVEPPFRAARPAPRQDDFLPVVEPDLEHEHDHQVPQVHEPEHRHRRLGVRRQVHLQRPLRVPEVQLQRQRRDEQEREGRQQRQPVGRLDGFDVEHALERGQDERARHQPGHERVEDDEHAPLELHLVRVHEPLHHRQHALHRSPPPSTAPNRPGRCSTPSHRSPSAASAPARGDRAGTGGSGPSGSSGHPAAARRSGTSRSTPWSAPW